MRTTRDAALRDADGRLKYYAPPDEWDYIGGDDVPDEFRGFVLAPDLPRRRTDGAHRSSGRRVARRARRRTPARLDPDRPLALDERAALSALARRVSRWEAEFALAHQVEQSAADVGRLRRRLASIDGWTGLYIVERLGHRLETIDAILQPDAAELYREAFALCGDDDLAVEEALATVDARAEEFRRLLGDRRSS
jgi:hypothetical protein